MIFYLLLFPLIIQANTAIEKYCFHNDYQANVALKEFYVLKLPNDSIQSVGPCLIISMDPKRVELFQKYLHSQFPEAKVEFSSLNTYLNECELTIEKKQILKEENRPISLSTQTSMKSHSTNNDLTEISFIKTKGPFELIHDQTKLEGNCRYINKNQYEISLNYSQLSLPNKIANENNSGFLTQINLVRGSKVQIFKIDHSSSRSNKEVTLPPKFTHHQNSKILESQFFLSIK